MIVGKKDSKKISLFVKRYPVILSEINFAKKEH